MDERKRAGILQQYENARNIIASLPVGDDVQIMQAAYQSILRIVLVTTRSDVPIAQASDDAFRLRLSTMQGILKSVEDFVKSSAERQLSPELSAQAEAIDDLNRRLEAVRANRIMQINNIERLRADIEAHEAESRQKTATETGLSKHLTDLQAKIDELDKQKASLDLQINAANVQYNTLLADLPIKQGTLEEQQETNRKLQEQIDSVKAQIAAQPEEKRVLQQEHEKLTQRLDDTKNALERCSEAKQQELHAQIESLEPERKQLEDRYEELAAAAKEAERLKKAAEIKVDQELTALWPQLTGIMTTLSGKVGALETELNETRQRAEAFYATVRECDMNLKRLQQWYKAEKTPLDALYEQFEHANDYTDQYLRQTWNVNQSEEIRNRMRQADEILTEVGNMIRDASNAAERDEEFVRRCADTNEVEARAAANRKK